MLREPDLEDLLGNSLAARGVDVGMWSFDELDCGHVPGAGHIAGLELEIHKDYG